MVADGAPALVRFDHDLQARHLDPVHHQQAQVGDEQRTDLVGRDVGPPDVEAEQWPQDVIAGRDPQLEKAIEIVLEQLEENPPPEYERPPYPVRVRE